VEGTESSSGYPSVGYIKLVANAESNLESKCCCCIYALHVFFMVISVFRVFFHFGEFGSDLIQLK
jgi:hypothetical protein